LIPICERLKEAERLELAPTGGKILFSIASGFSPRQLKKDLEGRREHGLKKPKRLAPNFSISISMAISIPMSQLKIKNRLLFKTDN
jgi:hypothetical protein